MNVNLQGRINKGLAVQAARAGAEGGREGQSRRKGVDCWLRERVSIHREGEGSRSPGHAGRLRSLAAQEHEEDTLAIKVTAAQKAKATRVAARGTKGPKAKAEITGDRPRGEHAQRTAGCARCAAAVAPGDETCLSWRYRRRRADSPKGAPDEVPPKAGRQPEGRTCGPGETDGEAVGAVCPPPPCRLGLSTTRGTCPIPSTRPPSTGAASSPRPCCSRQPRARATPRTW